MNNVTKGVLGEQIAQKYLEDKGYSFITRNFRAGKSEIDLIMQDNETVVFTEVKARTTNRFGGGLYAVTDRKQCMIIQGAKSFCVQNNLFEKPMRFDVIEVDLTAGCVCKHVENAFLIEESI